MRYRPISKFDRGAFVDQRSHRLSGEIGEKLALHAGRQLNELTPRIPGIAPPHDYARVAKPVEKAKRRADGRARRDT